jgi:hypothetical protein
MKTMVMEVFRVLKEVPYIITCTPIAETEIPVLPVLKPIHPIPLVLKM